MAPLEGPKRPRNAEEARDEDDGDIPPAPGVIFDSVALVDDDEATESDSHQPEHEAAQEPGLSGSAVEEFIIFEHSCWPATG